LISKEEERSEVGTNGLAAVTPIPTMYLVFPETTSKDVVLKTSHEVGVEASVLRSPWKIADPCWLKSYPENPVVASTRGSNLRAGVVDLVVSVDSLTAPWMATSHCVPKSTVIWLASSIEILSIF